MVFFSCFLWGCKSSVEGPQRATHHYNDLYMVDGITENKYGAKWSNLISSFQNGSDEAPVIPKL